MVRGKIEAPVGGKAFGYSFGVVFFGLWFTGWISDIVTKEFLITHNPPP